MLAYILLVFLIATVSKLTENLPRCYIYHMEALHLLDVDNFHDYTLKIFKIENSIFTIKYSENVYPWLEINCKSFDREDEIEFSECVLSTQRMKMVQFSRNRLGYTKKYTFNNDELTDISAYFTGTNFVDDFER
ncbi:hypothetical protein RF11_06011 [Thelohanellus kitauei]|uniref:Uncharacterized protein n=1 Tax=Thelohanellus kitauei TaxID=669202 RepID=A0A0C2N320_THEKT|nr:hypothetical protein RF11_06011 [Thelohanellus kitauei]